MELTVKVVKILPEQSFTSRKDGNEIRKYAFVGTTTNERFEKTICFYAFGDVWLNANVIVGGTYEVSFDVSSREYKERWYTECTCWKISAANAQAPAPAQQQAQVAQPSTAAPANNNADGSLPF